MKFFAHSIEGKLTSESQGLEEHFKGTAELGCGEKGEGCRNGLKKAVEVKNNKVYDCGKDGQRKKGDKYQFTLN